MLMDAPLNWDQLGRLHVKSPIHITYFKKIVPEFGGHSNIGNWLNFKNSNIHMDKSKTGEMCPQA